MKKIKLFIIILGVIFCADIFAQNTLSNLSSTFEFVSDSTTLSQLDSSLLAMENRTLSVSVNCTGSGIEKLAVSVGTAEGSNDVFYKQFDYGQTGTFGGGTSYSVAGDIHSFVIGTYSGFGDYYLEIKALLSNGEQSDPIRTTIN